MPLPVSSSKKPKRIRKRNKSKSKKKSLTRHILPRNASSIIPDLQDSLNNNNDQWRQIIIINPDF